MKITKSNTKTSNKTILSETGFKPVMLERVASAWLDNSKQLRKIGIVINGVWYNKLAKPYTPETMLQAGQTYQINLINEEITLDHDTKNHKCGEKIVNHTFRLNTAAIKLVSF